MNSFRSLRTALTGAARGVVQCPTTATSRDLRTTAAALLRGAAVSPSSLDLLGADDSLWCFGGPAASTAVQCRHKHSMRQKKRMANHPARLRVLHRVRREEDLELRRMSGEEGTAKEISSSGQPPPPRAPAFPPVFEPMLLPNGWSAPPPDREELLRRYPFRIERTGNKPLNAAGFLPVYTRKRKDGTKTTTRIRGVTGDSNAFLEELRAAVPGAAEVDVRIRAGGSTLELSGNHVRSIKLWLAGLGF